MEKTLFNEKPRKDRQALLDGQADSVVNENYYVNLTDEELTARKHDFTSNALKVDDLEEQKKEVTTTFKTELAPLKIIHKTLGREIRTGVAEREGTLYVFIDHSTKTAYYYDVDGYLIPTKTRPANETELTQMTLHKEIREIH